MALALNNLKRVDMPLNKETKPNQTYKVLLLWARVHLGAVEIKEYSTFPKAPVLL